MTSKFIINNVYLTDSLDVSYTLNDKINELTSSLRLSFNSFYVKSLLLHNYKRNPIMRIKMNSLESNQLAIL